MKYIRTKDNKIWCSEIENTPCGKSIRVGIEQWYYEKDFVQVADIIEELCDEFVVVAQYRFKLPKTGSEVNRDFDEMKDFYTDKDDIIYGAIWTDKGLIYVAKMNDEGELCLL